MLPPELGERLASSVGLVPAPLVDLVLLPRPRLRLRALPPEQRGALMLRLHGRRRSPAAAAAGCDAYLPRVPVRLTWLGARLGACRWLVWPAGRAALVAQVRGFEVLVVG